jgi:hypothetical protein
MSVPKLLSLRTIVLKALATPRGSMKVTAALGELLAADAMVNLCSLVGFWNAMEHGEKELHRVAEIDQRAHEAVNQAWRTFEAAPDAMAASGEFVEVLRDATADLRSLLSGVDFYDDQVVNPRAAEG